MIDLCTPNLKKVGVPNVFLHFKIAGLENAQMRTNDLVFHVANLTSPHFKLWRPPCMDILKTILEMTGTRVADVTVGLLKVRIVQKFIRRFFCFTY